MIKAGNLSLVNLINIKMGQFFLPKESAEMFSAASL